MNDLITIVDYGMGNLGSVVNMLKKVGAGSIVSSDLETIRNAKKVILPGVGAFDTAMKRIDELGLREILVSLALEKKVPFLGICLGMQLLMEKSEEGKLEGLGLLKGAAYHFSSHIDKKLNIPHMGWNEVRISNETQLTKNYEGEIRFYFVHSYFVRVVTETDSMMKCSYGIDFDAAVCHDNIFGVQFHPEKSHKYGMNLFNNFAGI